MAPQHPESDLQELFNTAEAMGHEVFVELQTSNTEEGRAWSGRLMIVPPQPVKEGDFFQVGFVLFAVEATAEETIRQLLRKKSEIKAPTRKPGVGVQ